MGLKVNFSSCKFIHWNYRPYHLSNIPIPIYSVLLKNIKYSSWIKCNGNYYNKIQLPIFKFKKCIISSYKILYIVTHKKHTHFLNWNNIKLFLIVLLYHNLICLCWKQLFENVYTYVCL